MGLGLTNLELKPITIISAVSIWYFISFFFKKSSSLCFTGFDYS